MMQQEFYKLEEIISILKKENPQSIFLVTGKSSYEASKAKESIDQILRTYHVVKFDDFRTNPILDDVKKGVNLLKNNNCDMVIAVGGGSVLDIAKSINIFAAHDGDLEPYVKKELPFLNEGLPFIAVPTTAGTGSEATHFAVLYIEKTKYSLAHPSLLPKYVILDAGLTANLPAKITASTGMDAFGQAVESFWSINSTEESKQYSRAAIKLILKNLITAVKKPTVESRIAMMKAANLSGKAINIAKTTASHAVSYPITSYFNVPHGHAVAITLGEMLEYNSNVQNNDCLDQRGVDYVQKTLQELTKLFGVETAVQAKNKLNQFMEAIDLERKLSRLSITTDEHFAIIVKHGFNPERVKNNPRLVTEENLKMMLQKIK